MARSSDSAASTTLVTFGCIRRVKLRLDQRSNACAEATSRSLSVTVEPAEWVVRLISTTFHEFDQSGW